MNRSRLRLNAMRDIMSLRAVGARVAEARTVKAERDLECAQKHVRAKQYELDQTITHWQANLETGHFDPLTSVSWGQAVNSGVESVLVAQEGESHQKTVLDEAREALGTATANERCAESLLKQARTRWSRETERSIDDERADQTTRMFSWS